MFNLLTEPTMIKPTIWGHELISKFRGVPFVSKILNSKDGPLSVQVHPNAEEAKKLGYGCGKNEMWYVLEAEEDSYIYLGLSSFMGFYYPLKDSVRDWCDRGVILDYMQKYKATPGQFFIIPAGTIHCLGKGITVFEIAQDCDVTYRMYDHNSQRELQLDEGLNCYDGEINYNTKFLLD